MSDIKSPSQNQPTKQKTNKTKQQQKKKRTKQASNVKSAFTGQQ